MHAPHRSTLLTAKPVPAFTRAVKHTHRAHAHRSCPAAPRAARSRLKPQRLVACSSPVATRHSAAAPALLVFLRVCEGLALGAEYTAGAMREEQGRSTLPSAIAVAWPSCFVWSRGSP